MTMTDAIRRMHSTCLLWAALLLCALVVGADRSQGEEPSAIEKIGSALVRIHVTGVSAGGDSANFWGTGLFISDSGYIVTASHTLSRDRDGRLIEWSSAVGPENPKIEVEFIGANGTLEPYRGTVDTIPIAGANDLDVAVLKIAGQNYHSAKCSVAEYAPDTAVRGVALRPTRSVPDPLMEGVIAMADPADGLRYRIVGMSVNDGHSGGAIFQKGTETVSGIVTSGRDHRLLMGSLESFATPLYALKNTFPFSQYCTSAETAVVTPPEGVLTLQFGHSQTVTAATYSSDGRWIVSGSRDRTARLWDADSGTLLREFRGHAGRITCLAVSSDSKRIVSADGGSVRLWDTETGILIHEFRTNSPIAAVSLSHDGRQISAADSHDLSTWDVQTGQLLSQFKLSTNNSIAAAAFSSDRRILVVSSSSDKDPGLRVWNLDSGSSTVLGDGTSIQAISISSDRKKIISGQYDGSLVLWDLERGIKARTDEDHTPIDSVTFSPDGTHFVSGDGAGEIKIWDAALQSTVSYSPEILKGNVNGIGAVAFSPDGAYIVSSSDGGSLDIWDAGSGAQTRRLKGYHSEVKSVAFSYDGRRIVAGVQNNVRVWDATSGTMLKEFKGHLEEIGSVFISPAQDLILSASEDRSLRLWHTGAGKVSKELEPAESRGTNEVRQHRVAMSLDGRFAVSTGYFASELDFFETAELKLWDVRRGEMLHDFAVHLPVQDTPGVCCPQITTTLPGGGYPRGAAISPNNASILVAAWDSLRLFDLRSTRLIQTIPGGGSFVAFAPDNRTAVVGSSDNAFRSVDTLTGSTVREFKGHDGPVTSAVFSPDGQMIVSSSEDGTLRLWDANSSGDIRVFRGHTDRVNAVAFSPDGQHFASASDDGTVRLWGVTATDAVAVFHSLPEGNWMTEFGDLRYRSSNGAAEYLAIINGMQVRDFRAYEKSFRLSD